MLTSALFEGRKLIIATKHQKEKVIAPWMESALGVTCLVAESLDTDGLGTFTGEVERQANALDTARKKCLLAMELYQCDLAIANEGSFGAHPDLFFVPADDELVIFIDKKNELEIIARELSIETNYNGEEIHDQKQLENFATRAHFPHHGLIVRKSKDDIANINKGITQWNQLIDCFNSCRSRFGSAYVETDMRAMYNPMRMKVIEKATQNLVEKIMSGCPKCSMPGFGITQITRGLPCRLCNFPTRAVLSHLYSCAKCHFTEEVKYPTGRRMEDPTYCDQCNP